MEFEDAEPVEASHLVRGRCVTCGAEALCAPEALRKALCTKHIGSGLVVPDLKPQPVRGDTLVRTHGDAHQAWLLAQEDYTPPVPHPAPEHVGTWSKNAAGLDLDTVMLGGVIAPLPVLKLAEFSRENSWEAEMRYCRGNGVHAGHGRAMGLRHSIALRFHDHPVTARTAIAVYESPVTKIAWTWASVWVMGPDLPPCGALSLAELKEFLAEPGRPSGWFESIKKAAWERSQEAKARAKSRPKKARDQTGM
jgi:hypothetical protein